MKLKIIFPLLLLLYAPPSNGQGDIDRITEQQYMKGKENYNCSDHPGDALSYRICANLEFQKSDSLLSVVYDSLLNRVNDITADSLLIKLHEMQYTWRSLRDQHCRIVYDSYDCSNGNERSTVYLYCLTEMTNARIVELRKLNMYLKRE